MSPRQQWVAFTTILRKEVARVLRIWPQTLLPPVITMGIYLVVFGSFLGRRIADIQGHRYIDFIVPGLIMMSTITNAYSNVASSFFSGKFQRSVEEMLISPMPTWIMVLGYSLGGAVRGLLVGILVLATAAAFTLPPVRHLGLALAFIALAALLFGLAGFTNGILARKWDDIAIVPTFVLTPLTYFGGVFYSVHLLPPTWQKASYFNPILYMVDGFRYGFLGASDTHPAVGLILLTVLTMALLAVNMRLVHTGTGLRQ
ncbi:MAG TPA: ABC transporter permease [Candidatus Nitrosotenuis sp.]|jgi:ABC-2 type transport system permease protein|nr:ABC transporter permease [Candidatus Nitrosotenuis sp.]